MVWVWFIFAFFVLPFLPEVKRGAAPSLLKRDGVARSPTEPWGSSARQVLPGWVCGASPRPRVLAFGPRNAGSLSPALARLPYLSPPLPMKRGARRKVKFRSALPGHTFLRASLGKPQASPRRLCPPTPAARSQGENGGGRAGAAAPGRGSQPPASCTASPSKQTELMASRGREMDSKQMRL